MVSYRDHLDIVADILNVASRNAKKTQIMYQANLSYRVMQKYLAELNSAALIDYCDGTQCYMITSKGKQFLEDYKKYSVVNNRIEKALVEVNVKKANLEKVLG